MDVRGFETSEIFAMTDTKSKPIGFLHNQSIAMLCVEEVFQRRFSSKPPSAS